jgi:hypothetical protein
VRKKKMTSGKRRYVKKTALIEQRVIDSINQLAKLANVDFDVAVNVMLALTIVRLENGRDR